MNDDFSSTGFPYCPSMEEGHVLKQCCTSGWSKLYRLLIDIRHTAEAFYHSALELSRALRSSFKAVYEHDRFTCPASVWHASVEMARFYELLSDRLSAPLETLEKSLQIGDRRKPPMPLSQLQEFEGSFQITPAVQSMVTDVQTYLDQSPGNRVKCLARRFVHNKTEVARIYYSNRHFNRLRLARNLEDDLSASAFLLTYHNDFSCAYSQLYTLATEYDQVESTLAVDGPPPVAMLEAAADLCSFIYTKLRLRVCRDLLLNQKYSGWRSFRAKGGHVLKVDIVEPHHQCGRTIEDELGPFERWAH